MPGGIDLIDSARARARFSGSTSSSVTPLHPIPQPQTASSSAVRSNSTSSGLPLALTLRRHDRQIGIETAAGHRSHRGPVGSDQLSGGQTPVG